MHKQIEYSKIIGAKYIVFPYVSIERLTNEAEFQTFLTTIKKIAKEVKEQGLQFLYHNHTQEFEKKDGKFFLDLILEYVGDDLLMLELDLYWVKKAGLDPKMTLLNYKGHVPIIHVKDMDKNGDFTEVGRGIIDWPSIFAIAQDAGVKYYFVEQDVSQHPLESVKISIDYLNSIGIA